MTIKKLRKVEDHVHVVTPDDHNVHVDNWRAQLDVDEDLSYDDPELNALLLRLSTTVAQMRRVKHGDYYLARDHNLFVEAWKTQLDINEKLKYWKDRLVGAPPGALEDAMAKLRQLVSQMRTLLAGDFYYARDHNLFADAWNQQIRVNDRLYYWKELGARPTITIQATVYVLRTALERTFASVSASVTLWRTALHRIFVSVGASASLWRTALHRTSASVSASVTLWRTALLKTEATVSGSASLSRVASLRASSTVSGSAYLSDVVPLKTEISVSGSVSVTVEKS